MSAKSVLREYLEALVIAVIFAVFARTYVIQAFKIPSPSMADNLLVGDHILVNKFVYGERMSGLERLLLPMRGIERGDVVVFKFPEDPSRDFIKRCAGLPGDRIQLIDKVLYVNDLRVEDHGYTYRFDSRIYPHSRFLAESLRMRDNFGPYEVPQHHYFCLGDNRDNSNDSRFWGSVPAAYVKGRAFLIYWSFEGGGQPGERTGIAGGLASLGDVLLRFFTHTRWERSFKIVG